MKGGFNFKLVALCAILSGMLVVPAFGQGQTPPEQGQAPAMGMEKAKSAEPAQAAGHKAMGDKFKQQRIQMLKQLKLSPDKEQAVLAVEDKFVAQRKDTIAGLKKAQADLQAALAAPKPDEAKVKELVSSLTSGQDTLFNSFKSQRDEELALMTPVEQGKYLMAMSKMRGGKGKKK